MLSAELAQRVVKVKLVVEILNWGINHTDTNKQKILWTLRKDKF